MKNESRHRHGDEPAHRDAGSISGFHDYLHRQVRPDPRIPHRWRCDWLSRAKHGILVSHQTLVLHMDFPVDCQLFLQLTGVRLGEYGLYRIRTKGVFALTTKEDIEDCPMMDSGNEAIVLLDFIDEARLDFPTTAKKLHAWQQTNNGFPLPDWFNAVIDETNSERAKAIIDNHLNRLNDLVGKAERAVIRRTVNDQHSVLKKYVDKKSISQLQAERDMLKKIADVLTLESGESQMDRRKLVRREDHPMAGAGDAESAAQRRARLRQRKKELIDGGVRAWLQTLAKEERVSAARIKQLLK